MESGDRDRGGSFIYPYVEKCRESDLIEYGDVEVEWLLIPLGGSQRTSMYGELETHPLGQISVDATKDPAWIDFQSQGGGSRLGIVRVSHGYTKFGTATVALSVTGVEGRKLMRPLISSEWHGETLTVVADAAWIADVSRDGTGVVVRCRNAKVDLGDAELTGEGVCEFTLPTFRD